MSDGPRAYMFEAAMCCPACIAERFAHPAELGSGVSTETILDRVAQERGIDRSEVSKPFDSGDFPVSVDDGLNRSERCLNCQTFLADLDPAEESVLSAVQAQIVRWGDDYVWVDQIEEPEIPGEPYVVVGRTWSDEDQAWNALEGREYDPEAAVPLEAVSDERRGQLGLPSRERLAEDWHMRDQLPAPGMVPLNLDPEKYVYRMDLEQYPVNEDGDELVGGQLQYRLYAIGARRHDGSVRYYNLEEDTGWSYTSRWGGTHEQLRDEVTEWTSRLFARPIAPSHTAGSWELAPAPESPVGGRGGAAHGGSSSMPTSGASGGGALYQRGVGRLIEAAVDSGIWGAELLQFADGLDGNKWGASVVATVREAGTLMEAVDANYRNLALQIRREGDNGAAAHDSVPYAPDPDGMH